MLIYAFILTCSFNKSYYDQYVNANLFKTEWVKLLYVFTYFIDKISGLDHLSILVQ